LFGGRRIVRIVRIMGFTKLSPQQGFCAEAGRAGPVDIPDRTLG